MAGKYAVGGTDFNSVLQRSLDRYKTMQDELTSMKGTAAAPIASEFQDVADIYKTGGEYGKGAITRIQNEAKYGNAQGQANLVRTGMSSGSNSQGVAARYSRQAREGIQQTEDTRYDRLGSALTQLASARQARGLQMTDAYKTAATIAGQFKEPAASEYYDPYSLERLKNTGSTGAMSDYQKSQIGKITTDFQGV